VPVHLTKGYVVGAATAYNGPLHVVEEVEEPGAVLTMGVDFRDKPDEGFKTGRKAGEGIHEGKSPPHPPDKTCPKPKVHWNGVPGTLRGAVDDLLEEHEALWAGQLGKVDVTPHRIELTPGERPRRAKPYREKSASRDIIAKEVQRQRNIGVIEPSSHHREPQIRRPGLQELAARHNPSRPGGCNREQSRRSRRRAARRGVAVQQEQMASRDLRRGLASDVFE